MRKGRAAGHARQRKEPHEPVCHRTLRGQRQERAQEFYRQPYGRRRKPVHAVPADERARILRDPARKERHDRQDQRHVQKAAELA